MRKNIRTEPRSKRFKGLSRTIQREEAYDVGKALDAIKATATAKFPETVELAVKLGIDPKKPEQNVRGITTLPHGTGKSKKVAVLAKGNLAKEAEEAGAETVGAEELITKIQEGWRDFDVVLATEEMAPQMGKIGKALGPKTPNKRNGTLTNAIGQAVKEIKGATRVEYRIDKAGIIHLGIGKSTFTKDQLEENLKAALHAIARAKPPASKGRYFLTVTLSNTMGPGIKIDPTIATKFAS